MSSPNLNTRTRILDATWKLLESGDLQVRMSDIAKAAGVSRQAVYLHFPTRAELLVATTHHIDAAHDVDGLLAASRASKSGRDRLNLFIEAWGNYIPSIYGVGRALMAMQDHDEEARKAWAGRMQAVRHGCEAAVRALENDKDLRPDLSSEEATDLLWMLLSVRNWEHLTRQSGWSQQAYVENMKDLAGKALLVSTE